MVSHTVLIGLNYQPHRSSGDKNFWVELVPLLARELDRITILSIRKHPQKEEDTNVEGCRIVIKYLSPKFLESSDSTYGRTRIFWRGGAFPSWLGVIEKMLNIRTLLRELKLIYSDYPYQCLHLMDNMGFANRIIAKTAHVPVSVSAMGYQGKNPEWLYKKYLLISYKCKKLTVVPYSQAFAKKLLEIGLESSGVHWIPWGKYVDDRKVSNNCDKDAAKKKIDLKMKIPLILWTGYIQQITRKDFLFAYKIANKALAQGLEATFFFAFKPESFEKRFESYHRPEKNIIVKPTTVEEFNNLRQACDFLLSPVINTKCILAPPLTWIEVMAMGLPVLTTNVPGADEIIEDGKTGFKAKDENDIIEKVFLLRENFSQMQQACIEKIKKDFNIYNTASMYLKLWRRITYEI